MKKQQEDKIMGIKIFWAGDSTVAPNTYLTWPQTGIGQALGLYLKPEIQICNHAVNGRSTKSFIDEARLAAIYNVIAAGDYLFIQFGHNDEKREDPSRFTESFGEFMENLERYVNAARNKGALPVFITPLYRRLFTESKTLVENTHLDYPDAMKETGKRLDVPVIDLCASSRELIAKTPLTVSEKWFMNLQPGEYPSCQEGKVDNTHLTYTGAVIFAELVAEGLKSLGGRYEELLLEPENLRMPVKTEG